MSIPAIGFDDVSVAYGRHRAVHGVSGAFAPGSLTAIIGANGAGKSTLLKALMGEIAPARGRIDRGGLHIRDFGYLPQISAIDRQFPLSVADTIMLGAWRQTGAFGAVSAQAARRAKDALAGVGLDGFANRPIGSLSLGQFQRTLFARLMVQDADIIVLDEPFAAIDARTACDLIKIIRRWHGDGRTVIAVLHDFDQVRAYFPNALLLAGRMIDWGATDQVLSRENLKAARNPVENRSGSTAVHGS
ncbi:MAG: ABC transporter ATP-binding protein [Hyphomicrobiales bacterium]